MFLRLVCSSILVLSAGMPLGMQNPRERSILVTVLDQAGAPVKDVKPADPTSGLTVHPTRSGSSRSPGAEQRCS
jgi:hypothetical protein